MKTPLQQFYDKNNGRLPVNNEKYRSKSCKESDNKALKVFK